jgi:LysR family nitrogen assimilation transcriptional regulator
MNLNLIAHLVQVAEYGNFSKAASVIGIAQPALSRQMRKLEDECGVPLLYRHGRGVMLTPHGEKLLERVRPLLRQMEAAVSEATADQRSPSGEVTIGLTPTLCSLIGLNLLMAVNEQYPRVGLNIVSAYSGYVHEWLLDARLDLAIVHDARRSQHLAVEEVGELQLSLISSAASLAAGVRRPDTIDLAQIKDLPLVLPTKNHGLRRTMEYAASQAGFPLTVRYEIDAIELMIELVQRGLAHTVLHAPVVRRELPSGELVARLVTNPPVFTRLMLAKAANRPMTRAIRVVEACVKTLLDQSTSASPQRSA